MGEKMADPYAVIIKEKKLPLSLLNEPRGDSSAAAARRSLVATQPFADTFGKSQRRKRPKLVAESYEGLLNRAGEVEGSFADRQEAAGPAPEFDAARPAALESHFLKGQSKRIWGELYKVLDSSDVVIQVCCVCEVFFIVWVGAGCAVGIGDAHRACPIPSSPGL